MPAFENYHNTHIMTASPMELILMLYDEAVKSLGKAEEAFKIEGPGRIQEINNNLLHAQDIITELTASLNFEKGGEIASNLYKLYEFMIHQLSQANINKKVKPVREVKALMIELKEAWLKVAEKEPRGEEIQEQRPASNIAIAG
jgi:flagellar secretion chaperone FliS